MLGVLGKNLVQLAVLVVLARLLAPGDFGLVAAAVAVVSLLKVVAEVGIGPAIVQRKNLEVADIKTANTIALSLGWALFLLLYFSSGLIANFFSMDGLLPVMQAISLSLLFSGLHTVGLALLQKDIKFRQISFLGIFSYLVAYGAVGVPLALFGYSVWALVFATLSQTLCSLFIVLIIEKRSRQFGFDIGSCKRLLNFGFGHSLAKIASAFAQQADNIVIGRFLGAEALGGYTRAYQLMTVPALAIGGTVDKVVYPLMSMIQDDSERMARSYMLALSVVSMVAMPLSAILIVYADEIVSLLFGDQWGFIVPVFQVLTVIMVFRMSYKLSDGVVKAKGKVYRRAVRQLLFASLVVVGALIGRIWGLVGVASGVALAIFANYIIMAALAKSLISFSWYYFFIINAKNISYALFVLAGSLFIKFLLLQVLENVFLVLFLGLIFSSLVTLIGLICFKRFYASELGFVLPYLEKFAKTVLPKSITRTV